MTSSNERFPIIFELAERHYRESNFHESKELLAHILKDTPLDLPIARLLCLCHLRLGEYNEARRLADEALRFSPNDASTWNIAGEIERLSGDLHGAAERFSKAATIDSSNTDVLNNLGITQESLGLYEDARKTFEKALAINPQSALAWYNIANTLFRAKRFEESRNAYRNALAIRPSYPEALNNLGALLSRMERFRDATEIFDALTLIHPHFFDGLYNFAETLKAQGEFPRAIELYQRAIEEAPAGKRAQTLARLASVYRESGKRAEGLAAIQEAFRLDPLSSEVIHARINLELDCGNFQTARHLVEGLVERDTGNLSARLCLTMLQMPTIYETESEISHARDSYSSMLAQFELTAQSITPETAPAVEEILGNNQPFFLPYQGLDSVELQRRYGAAVANVMRQAIPLATRASRVIRHNERIRVGVVSGFFRNHSVYKMPVRGWLQAIDRSKFEIICYHTQQRIDQYTHEAAARCDKFVQGPKTTRQWVAEIVGDAPDILIFPEIGMDPMSGKLAAIRLAPIQATSWGHPVTSGLPTIDYFLSSDAMEPPDGETHYTERLVRLPGIGIHYAPLDAVPARLSRESIGVREDAVFFWCCQSNYKYLPQHDLVLAEIAIRIPTAQFCFITLLPDSEASRVFRARLKRTFTSRGLDPEKFLRFLPALPGEQFSGVAALADLCLDSIEWSGCNSSLEVLAQGTPIVTYRGKFMRGRHTAAFLERIGCPELITGTLEDYVRVVTEIAANRDGLMSLAAHIRGNIAALYHDDSSVRFLEEAMRDWLKNPRA